MKTHIRELDHVNALACLMVILIHVLSLGISGLDRASWQAAVVYLPWRMAACAVPAFLFTGAARLSLQLERPAPYGTYLLGRVKRILLPYVLWNLIYYAVFMSIGYVRPSAGDFLYQLCWGTLSSPFYYVVLVTQFYLLRPVWRWLVERVSPVVGLPACALLTFFGMKLGNLLGAFGVEFSYADRLFPSYLIFWAAGLYFGRYYERWRARPPFTPWACLTAALPYGCYLLLSWLLYARGFWLLDLDLCKVLADLLSITALLALVRLAGAPGSRWERGLNALYASSFFVYLSHCLILTLATRAIQLAGYDRMSLLLAGRFVACYTLPFLLFALSRRVLGKHGWVLGA